ncbi:purine permease 4 [Actinidia rufa]|uniref:Purine permease 4 n=1 Tax=Actinidia rufa TaxID=165716 RepID=A0A7J0DUT4_9ERIC|nr:purine permease 4 [Actinidia rufa]
MEKRTTSTSRNSLKYPKSHSQRDQNNQQNLHVAFGNQLLVPLCGLCLFNTTFQILLHPQGFKQMGLHLGPVRRLPPPPASHIFPVQIHRQTSLHGLHFISISDVFYYWIAVGSEQSTLLRGDLVPPRVNFLSPTVVPVGVQSRLIRGPPGLTRGKYFIGFFSTIAAGLMFALYLPVMERVYRRVDCYAMVVEMQLVMEAAATVLATAGMAAAGGGFSDMRRESLEVFDKGPGAYWWAVAGNVVTWQLCFMGTAGDGVPDDVGDRRDMHDGVDGS